MKFLAIISLLVALYFLYRIAYPKQTLSKKNDDIPEKRAKNIHNIMGKSRFVLPDRSKPLQTPATSFESDNKEDKPSIFASETEEKRSAAVPPDKLDEVFANDPDPDELDIPPDDENEDAIDYTAEEEAEELNSIQGREVMFAEGLDYDDLKQISKVVKEQPKSVNEETGKTLTALENTDMFEMLVSGDEGKRNWIQAIIDRNIRNRMPETESKTSGMDYGDFDIADFIGKKIIKGKRDEKK